MRRFLVPLFAAALLAGCSGGGTPAPEPASSAGPVRKMTHAEAQTLAAKYRDEAVATLGAPLTAPATESLVACEGPHTFAALTGGEMTMPAGQQPAALQKLRAHYTAEQYTVEAPSTDNADHGALNATGPDRVTVTVSAGDSADSVRVNVATPCYSSDEAL